MIDFKDVLDYCKAQAIVHTLQGSEEALWRSICRSYSKKFHTPLHLVLNMDPEQVMLAEFEDQLEGFDETKDLDGILDKVYMLEDPAYEVEKRKELQDFIDKAEREEDERLASGKPIHPSLKNEETLKEVVPSKELPKSGGINLSYLEREELEG